MTDDFNDMENLLTRYTPAKPDAALRANILQQARKRLRWSYIQAIAAMLLIGFNLAQIGTSMNHMFPSPHVDEGRTQQIASAIDKLQLSLTRDDTYAMAHQLAASECFPPLPLVHGYIHTINGVTP